MLSNNYPFRLCNKLGKVNEFGGLRINFSTVKNINSINIFNSDNMPLHIIESIIFPKSFTKRLYTNLCMLGYCSLDSPTENDSFCIDLPITNSIEARQLYGEIVEDEVTLTITSVSNGKQSSYPIRMNEDEYSNFVYLFYWHFLIDEDIPPNFMEVR